MWIRTLTCALLIGAASAIAAPPHETAVAPEDIDVDALARAKDVDAAAAAAATGAVADRNDADSTDAAAEASASASAQVTEPDAPLADADAADAMASADTPAASGGETVAAQESTPATDEATSTVPAAEAATQAATNRDVLEVPATTPDAEERRLAASCTARATRLLDAAEKGDYADATKDFDAKMSSALPPAAFGKAWASLSQFGKLKARGQSHPIKGEGYVAVTIPLIFEKKNLYAQVACGNDGRVAGFYVKPLEIPAQ